SPAAPPAAPPPTTGAGAPPAPGVGAAATPTALAAQPKRGGTLRFPTTGTYPHMDVQQSASPTLSAYGAGVCYSKLLRFESGPDIPQPSVRIGPELAESWEQPDDNTYIFRLRKG